MRFPLLLLPLALLAISEAHAGQDTFKFKKEPISLYIPADCMLERKHKEKDNSVDFAMGKYYWMAFGLYSVQVFHRTDKTPDAATFLANIKDMGLNFLAHDRSPDFAFQFVGDTTYDIRGEPAYRVVGVDKGKAVEAVTFVMHKSRITIASLIYPEQSSPEFGSHVPFKAVTLDVPFAATFPWDCYTRFVESVEETD